MIHRVDIFFNNNNQVANRGIFNFVYIIQYFYTIYSRENFTKKKPFIIVLECYTQEFYDSHPLYILGEIRYPLKESLVQKGIYNLSLLESMTFQERKQFVWDYATECFKKSAKFIEDGELCEVFENTYRIGIENNLFSDFLCLSCEGLLFSREVKASIRMKDHEDDFAFFLIIEQDDKIIYEKMIYQLIITKSYISFLSVLKKMEINSKKNQIVLRGGERYSIEGAKFPIRYTILESELDI